jgi:hypothetical protein
MDYSQYYVVPAAERAAVAKLFEPHRIIDDGKFLIVVSDDHKLAGKLNVALDFHNDEWSAWGFTLYAKGKQIAHGLFGENDESGVSLEDNCLEGDLDVAAKLLGADAAKLRKMIEVAVPDVEKFIKAVGFGRYSITPFELDSDHPTEKKALFDPEHFAMEDGVARKRAAKKPAKKKPAKKKPAKKKPAKKKPAKKKPAKKKPAKKARRR